MGRRESEKEQEFHITSSLKDTINMTIPAIIYLVLASIGMLITAHDHGKPRKPNNFWAGALAQTLVLGLLYWGGFFN
jgi:hypothetical protein